MEDEWPDSPDDDPVSRKLNVPQCTVWPAFCLRPLPEIPVPLSPPDTDVQLALQPMIEAIYERLRYGLDIDYRQRCRPRLDAAHVEWLQEHLPTAAERPS